MAVSRTLRDRPRRRGGLSLLELLAVVAILGIVAAVVIPRYSSETHRAKERTNAYNLTAINTAIERYYVETGSWPATLGEMVPDYLPGGVPSPPFEGQTYAIDPSTHRAVVQ